MSSILKALKRIEGQPPPPRSFPALPDSVDAKRAINSNTGRRWRLRKLAVVSLVVLIVVVGVVIFYQQRHMLIPKIFPDQSPSTEQGQSQPAEKKSKIFTAKIPVSAAKRSSPETGPSRRQEPQTKSLVAKQPATRIGPAATENRLPDGNIGDKPDLKPSSRQPLTPSKKSIAGKRTASRKPARSDATVSKSAKSKRTYTKLNDSQIKLQALAWSADPARRMAVINGRIVREGESLDGYQINQIRQEDVVVSDGGQLWSLEFGLKQ